MAIDPKHLPNHPETLQQMILDLLAQLHSEVRERAKLQHLLEELLTAKRGRNSEQLSPDQLALFEAAYEAAFPELPAAAGALAAPASSA